MSSSTRNNHALLKGLVIGLGVMILIAFALLVYGLVTRMGSTPENAAGPQAAVEAPQPPAAQTAAEQPAPQAASPAAPAFGELRVDLPQSCRVERVEVVGPGRLLAVVGGSRAADCPLAVVLDIERGEELGRIHVEDAAATEEGERP